VEIKNRTPQDNLARPINEADMHDITKEISEGVIAVVCVVFILMPLFIIYESARWVLGKFGIHLSEI